MAFGFYLDAALTQPATTVAFSNWLASGAATHDMVLYVGSQVATEFAQPAAGVDNPIEAYPYNNGIAPVQPVAAVKLALTQAGLDSAVAGAALTLKPANVPFEGGTGNALAVWVRLDDQLGNVQIYQNLSLHMTEIDEYTVV